MEFLDRDAKCVTFVERADRFATGIESELRRRNLGHRATVHRSDAIKWLRRPDDDQYEILFADPPYDSTNLQELINAIDESERLMPDAIFILEHSSRTSPPQPELNANLTLIRSRKYGDTSLTIYRMNQQPEHR